MRKVLLLAAAAAAAMSVNAKTITYDFYTTPLFCELIFWDADANGEHPSGEEGLNFASNYDFIDKTGTSVNTDGTMFNEKDDDGNWHAIKNRCISLVDGLTYTMEGEETIVKDGDEITYTAIDPTHPFIGWDQEGKGPSRTLLMKGWGTLDEWTDANYNAIDADNWVATKNAIAFNRNANTGSRTGTYVQFPAVKDPSALTIYIGHAGGNYLDKGLYAEVVPVVDGVVGETIEVQGPADAVAKRMYKVDVALPEGLKGNVAFRIGCGGSELNLYHVIMEAAEGGASVAAVAAESNAVSYNMFGQRVDASYKGIVIRDGKKFVQK